MPKGSGGGGGRKNSGGAGGRSSRSREEVMRDLSRALGAEMLLFAGAFGVAMLADERIGQTISYESRRLSRQAFQKAVSSTAEVTKGMRDKVRAWAERKAGEAATKAARAANPGAVNAEGVAMHAIRGVLGDGKMSDAIPKMSKGRIADAPDKAYFRFKKGGNVYSGADIKSLARDAIASGNWSYSNGKRKGGK